MISMSPRTPIGFLAFLILSLCALSPAALATQQRHGSAPGGATATCGNGHLDPDETCASCAADCATHACTPSGKHRSFDVHFDPPAEMRVSSITVSLAYDSRRISLPGSAGAESIAKRLSNKQ